MKKFKAALVLGIVGLMALAVSCASEKKSAEPTAMEDDNNDAAAADLNCAAGSFVADATASTGVFSYSDYPSAGTRAGDYQKLLDSWVVADGRMISPVGSMVLTAGLLPLGLAVFDYGDERLAAVLNGGRGAPTLELIRFDGSGEVVNHYKTKLGTPEREVGRPFYGVVFNSTGDRLFVSLGGENVVEIFEPVYDGLNFISSVKLGGYIAGLALSADEKTLYAVGSNNNRFYAVDVSNTDAPTLRWSASVGFFPYAIALSADGGRAYVSNWQGASVSVVDLAAHELIALIEVDKNPEELALSPDGARLFVANSDGDTVSVIDTETNEVAARIDTTHNAGRLLGSSPSALAVNEKENLLYVALSDRNQVDVIDIDTLEIVGSIPSGWRPTKVIFNSVADEIFILNAKGVGGGPNPHGPHVTSNTPGSVQMIPEADEATLLDFTEACEVNNSRRYDIYSSSCQNIFPVPQKAGEESPIKHVVWIMKENKTYDEVLGDLAGESGDRWHDPELTVFGEQYTPNIHTLARGYSNFVNYYIPIEVSLQGHTVFTAGTCNNFCEKTHNNQMVLPSIEPGSIPGTGTIFDLCYKNGVSFRNYGQIVGFGVETLGAYADFIDYRYPFWNDAVLDVDKAAEVIREMKAGVFPEFVYISLPNDHTLGGKCGFPVPKYFVSDNDAGVGKLVEAISHSPYWEETLILIFQDDAQSSSGDHIDSRRSLLVAISPWVKRGYQSEVHYSAESIFKTTEMILGLPPIGSFDGEATPMYDIFTDQPDFTPYEAIENPTPLEYNCPGAAKARLDINSIEEFEDEADDQHAGMDLTKLDRAPGLGDVIWKIMKGDQPRPPQAKRLDE